MLNNEWKKQKWVELIKLVETGNVADFYMFVGKTLTDIKAICKKVFGVTYCEACWMAECVEMERMKQNAVQNN